MKIKSYTDLIKDMHHPINVDASIDKGSVLL